jgi:hypothetical protein
MPIWEDYKDLCHHPLKMTQVNCYRKMRVFDQTVAHLFGKRCLWMDLDTVILDDFSHLLTDPSPFVGWSPSLPKNIWNREQYSGSMFLFTPGHRAVTEIWSSFHFETSPKLAMDAGFNGSDQAWMSYVLGPGWPVWRARDGVIWYPSHAEEGLPDGTKIAFFTGDRPPWGEELQQVPWIKENWR